MSLAISLLGASPAHDILLHLVPAALALVEPMLYGWGVNLASTLPASLCPHVLAPTAIWTLGSRVISLLMLVKGRLVGTPHPYQLKVDVVTFLALSGSTTHQVTALAGLSPAVSH